MKEGWMSTIDRNDRNKSKASEAFYNHLILFLQTGKSSSLIDYKT